jgi:predicted site-specific integrase-resolvase
MGTAGQAEKVWRWEKTMNGAKRAAIYVRVSTVEQETDLQLETQRRRQWKPLWTRRHIRLDCL